MGALSDRYQVLGLLASGGMASVLYGRLRGPAGFQREVAIKRLHPHFAREPEFRQMFVDEAHICARLSHANIVSAFDVIETPPDLCLVMEYVPGAGLDVLLHAARARGADVPLRIAGALLTNVLHGLHSAHEAHDEQGSLGIVHRDVSPSNVLVGEDGVGRVLDFGIARVRSKLRTTPGNELKGKFSYMAPELLRGEEFDRRLDVYAAAVVLWEALTGRALYGGQPSAAIVRQVLEVDVAPPSRYRADVSEGLDRVVLRGLARDPAQRFASARELATSLERECGVASQHEVSEWMRGLVGELLTRRASELRRLQREVVLAPGERAGGARLDPTREPTTQVGEREETQRRSVPELTQTVIEPPLELTIAESASLPPPPRRRAPLVAAGVLSLLALAGLVFARMQRVPTKSHAAAPATSPVAPVAEPVQAPVAEPVQAPLATPVQATPPERKRAPRKRAPAAPSVIAPDPCTHAVQLELIDGVVVKTYKPECLK
jgi:serine/threonine protein kinase